MRNLEGLKVSNEFTVPLCVTHRHNIYTTRKERKWWQQRNLDPLKVADALGAVERDSSAPESDKPEHGRSAERDVKAAPANESLVNPCALEYNMR
jgi:hypothetical protein